MSDHVFTAVFPLADRAARFYERLVRDPKGDYAKDIKRKRANGTIVTWTLDQDARTVSQQKWPAMPEAEKSVACYEASMRETVGYYGNNPGEPPFHAGERFATLNGIRCPHSY